MRVLITGSTGLVGRNIAEAMCRLDFEILTPSHNEVDLLDYSAILSYIHKNKPDLIIHCAGIVGGIQANIDEPIKFFLHNLDIGRNVVMAAFNCGVQKLINFGSSCMYPRNAMNPLKEEYLLQGELEPTNEGYALAKIATQRMCRYIMQKNPSFRYITLLPCNLYGKYDKFNLVQAHLIPAAIVKTHTAKINKTDVQIWGSGLVRREFMFIEDLVECVLFSLQHFNSLPEMINIGIGTDHSINEYYQTVAEIIGFNGNFIHDTTKPEGMKQKTVDTSLFDALGWKSHFSLAEGIKKTYSYYLDSLRKAL